MCLTQCKWRWVLGQRCSLQKPQPGAVTEQGRSSHHSCGRTVRGRFKLVCFEFQVESGPAQTFAGGSAQHMHACTAYEPLCPDPRAPVLHLAVQLWPTPIGLPVDVHGEPSLRNQPCELLGSRPGGFPAHDWAAAWDTATASAATTTSSGCAKALLALILVCLQATGCTRSREYQEGAETQRDQPRP